jgi:hypothetical protein
MTNDYTGHVPVDSDEYPTTAAEAAGEELEYDPAPCIYIRGEFVGGDPTLNRVRDVSVSIPVREDDRLSEYGQLIAVTLAELAKLGNLASYETTLNMGGQTERIRNASSPPETLRPAPTGTAIGGSGGEA